MKLSRTPLTFALAVSAFALALPLRAQGVVYVDANAASGGDGLAWATAFDDLHDALVLVDSAGGTYDQIWIAEGTYVPENAHATSGDPRNRKFSLPDTVVISIYGGFAGGEASVDESNPALNPTILSGDFNGDDLPGFLNMGENAYHVVRSELSCPGFGLYGLTIQSGNANAESEFDGAGAFLKTLGKFTIANCTFRINNAVDDGAGLFLSSSLTGAHGEIVNSVFEQNRSDSGTAAGAYLSLTGFPDLPTFIRDCLFELNTTATGNVAAAYVNTAAAMTMERCEFVNNDGWSRGAVLLGGRDNIIAGCTFEANSGDVGGALSLGESVGYIGSNRIESCLFRGNVANGEGAAIIGYSIGFTDVINCTFTENLSLQGAGIYAVESVVNVRNSILWGNTATAGADLEVADILANIIVEYSDVEGGYFGPGNLDVDPLFDADMGLLPGSPCIDAGDTGEVQTDVDAAGLPRRVDDPMTADSGTGAVPLPDLGALEYQTLVGSPDSLSTATGGIHAMELNAGASLGGQLYWLLGSLSGSSPGFPYDGLVIALNPDSYFTYTSLHPNTPPLTGSLGNLQVDGTASASFTLPAALFPELAGATAVHAFVVIDLGTLGLLHSSNAVPLTFTP